MELDFGSECEEDLSDHNGSMVSIEPTGDEFNGQNKSNNTSPTRDHDMDCEETGSDKVDSEVNFNKRRCDSPPNLSLNEIDWNSFFKENGEILQKALSYQKGENSSKKITGQTQLQLRLQNLDLQLNLW